MALKPIRNDEDNHAALQEIEQLWDAEPGTPESDTLDILVTLVEAYEKKSLRLAVARSYRRAGVFHGEPRLDTQAVGTVPRQPRTCFRNSGPQTAPDVANDSPS